MIESWPLFELSILHSDPCINALKRYINIWLSKVGCIQQRKAAPTSLIDQMIRFDKYGHGNEGKPILGVLPSMA